MAQAPSCLAHSIKADPLIIPDSFEGHDLSCFSLPLHYRDDLKSVLIPYGLVQDRIEALASRIFSDLRIDPPEQLICMCVLKGGYRFFADLIAKIQRQNRLHGTHSLPMSLEFIRTRSCTNDQLATVDFSDFRLLKDRHLLLVQDVIDTGSTMEALRAKLERFQPKSIRVASLLSKRRRDQRCALKPDYCGFEISEHFIVGYALDYNEYFRDLEHICILKDSGLAKYKADEVETNKQS